MMMMLVVMTMTTTYEDFLNDLTHHLKSCLNATTFMTTSIPMCHEWEFMLLSLKQWNRVLFTILKADARKDL
jgi:hypothetical protein